MCYCRIFRAVSYRWLYSLWKLITMYNVHNIIIVLLPHFLHRVPIDAQCSSYAYFRGRCVLPVLSCTLPDYPAPCPNYLKTKINFSIFYFFYLQNVIAVFVFLDSQCKNACNCLQICAHDFINRPLNCAKTSFHSHAGL